MTENMRTLHVNSVCILSIFLGVFLCNFCEKIQGFHGDNTC